jgi:diacylglycerol kinase family enzyme
MGVEVYVTEAGDDIVALAEQAVANGADVLGVSGGDGTLAAVATVAMKHGLPLVVLPGGTKCHFARDIGLDPENMPQSLDGFSGVERLVDVGEINGRTFLNNTSLGLYAAIVSRDDYRHNKAGVTGEVTRELVTSPRPYYDLEFVDKDGKHRTHAAVIQVGVNRVEVMSWSELGARKRMDEGVLHVIVLPELTDQSAGQLVGAMMPFRRSSIGYLEWTATSFTVSNPNGNLMAGIDGETVALDSPKVTINIKKQALRLYVPAAGPTSRHIKPFSRDAFRALGNILAGKAV